MTAWERVAANVMRQTGSGPAHIWDLRLDPYWRGLLCRVGNIPEEMANDDWAGIRPEFHLPIARAMFDSLRLGRVVAGRALP